MHLILNRTGKQVFSLFPSDRGTAGDGFRLVSIGAPNMQTGTGLIRSFIRPTIIWLVLFLTAYALIFSSHIEGALSVLYHRAVTIGTVVALHPEEHQVVDVAYEVDGKRYTTSTSHPEDLGLPAFDRLSIGDQVRVEYSPFHPSQGILGNAEEVLDSNLKDIALMAIFLGFATLVFEFRLQSYLKKSRVKVSTREDPHRSGNAG